MGCARRLRVHQSPAPRAAQSVSATAPAPAGLAHRSRPFALCAERLRCTVGAPQPIEGLENALLRGTEIAPPPDAGSDEEHCRRREYWLERPTGNVLLVADCEAQWGADSQGPAQVTLAGARLEVRYVEFQAGDRCETLNAVINLVSAQIERQERTTGLVSRDQCNSKQSMPDFPPPGDGSVAHPLLVLHVD